jgi:UDP-N-acetylmuramyl pentapeptide phosphotransferase/UDP-N-acetylglucosamine-1-phosphate transferase
MTPAWNPWAGSAILIAIGMFLIVMSYGAFIQSKRTGRHISGIPFFGGLFVFLGFIISPIKWLAFLALLDYSYLMLIYCLLSERFKQDKKK